MKQSEVIVGKQYLFRRTTVEHKKDMEGTVVRVVKKKTGSRKYVSWEHPNQKSPARYLLDNGRYANAGELAEVTP